jgi:hypothetical protein
MESAFESEQPVGNPCPDKFTGQESSTFLRLQRGRLSFQGPN